MTKRYHLFAFALPWLLVYLLGLGWDLAGG